MQYTYAWEISHSFLNISKGVSDTKEINYLQSGSKILQNSFMLSSLILSSMLYKQQELHITPRTTGKTTYSAHTEAFIIKNYMEMEIYLNFLYFYIFKNNFKNVNQTVTKIITIIHKYLNSLLYFYNNIWNVYSNSAKYF